MGECNNISGIQWSRVELSVHISRIGRGCLSFQATLFTVQSCSAFTLNFSIQFSSFVYRIPKSPTAGMTLIYNNYISFFFLFLTLDHHIWLAPLFLFAIFCHKVFHHDSSHSVSVPDFSSRSISTLESQRYFICCFQRQSKMSYGFYITFL